MAPKHISIGVDIGGTHIACAAVHLLEGRLIPHTRARVACDHTAAPDVILARWASALNETLSRIDPAGCAGIGFAIPGPFDYRGGISRMQHKFKQLYGLHIPSALNPLLAPGHDLPMRFLNDATSFAIGEAWMGEGRGAQKVVVITLGTGFGSAFLHAGVPVVTGGSVPKEGCLWHLPYRDGIADDYFSTRWFTQAYQKQTGENLAGVKDLMEKAASEPPARALFDQFGRNLAECLAPWLGRFGAEILVVGGNIANALPLFEPGFQEGLSQAGVSVRIAPSRLLETAALLGSARLLDDVFWGKVAEHLPAI